MNSESHENSLPRLCQTVRKFTRACEPCPNAPTKMTQEEIYFLFEMVGDEFEELELAETVLDQIDALVDAIYYIADMACRKGLNLDPHIAIVHEANMAKIVRGKVKRRQDGKILKPEDWQAPEPRMAEVLKLQNEYGSFDL